MRKTEFDKLIPTSPREPKRKSSQEALQSLMRLCARAERTTGDARRLMSRWGVPEEEREGVVQRLVEQRFIDNRRYAEAYTREKSQLAGWGARKISMHLAQKGVEREIIAQVVATLDGDAQLCRLEERLRRKLRMTKAASDYELRGKLLRYALSQGYDYDTAFAAVDNIIAER